MRVFYKFLLLLIILTFTGCSSDQPVRLKIGDAAPDFMVEDLAGRTFKLSSFKGRPVVIRFFVTDCKFCRADTPIFNEYYAKHRQDGLTMLYLTTTTNRQLVEKFVAELKVPFPVAIDYGKKVSEQFNVKVEPQTIILDAAHLIRGAILGGVTEVELDEVLGSGAKEQRE